MWDSTLMICFLCITLYFIRKLFAQNESNKIIFHGKYLFYYIYVCTVAFFIWPLFLLKPKHPRNCRWAAKFSIVITALLDLDFCLRNGEILKEDRGAIIVSNHQSSLDILGMFSVWDVAYKLTAVAKKELFYVWPFGIAAYLAGVIFIDRSNAQSAYKSLQISSRVMTEKKTKIWMYPEGTRNKDYTTFLPFKKGAFVMAISAQVPIIPIVYSPYYFVNRKKHIFKKGRIIMQCLNPVSTTGLTLDDVPKLIDKIQNHMFDTYKQLTKEVLNNLPADYPFTTEG